MNQNSNSNRIAWVDILRGIAILIMIPANLSSLYPEVHPLWFRIFTSYAAPLFIMLSAGMVVLNVKKHSLRYYLVRGGIIVSYGILIDLILWKLVPGLSFDILYLIGFSLPVVYLVSRYNKLVLLLFTLLIFVLTYLLQQSYGYHTIPLEVHLNQLYWPGGMRILQSWFIDGWFPLLPWLSYAFMGIILFRDVFLTDQKQSKKWLILGVFLCIVGMMNLWPLLTESTTALLSNRGGYSEVFYPLTVSFTLHVVGVIILLAWLVRYIPVYRISQFVILFGQYSLLIYILHQTIGVYLIEPLCHEIHNGWFFTLVVLLTIGSLYLLCLIIEGIKQYKRPRSLMLQMLVGK